MNIKQSLRALSVGIALACLTGCRVGYPVEAKPQALDGLPERCDTLPAETAAVKAYIEAFISETA